MWSPDVARIIMKVYYRATMNTLSREVVRQTWETHIRKTQTCNSPYQVLCPRHVTVPTKIVYAIGT